MPDANRNNDLERYLSQADVADYLKVSPRTIRRWSQTLGLPSHKIGDIVRFRRDEVDAWVQAQKEAA
jgi:excisionase family DNA binding protein